MQLPIQRFEVQGKSMEPTLKEGDRVVVFRTKKVQKGDVVVFYKNGMQMVKRISGGEGGRWQVDGDNPLESTNSLDFGDVRTDQIVGRVIAAY